MCPLFSLNSGKDKTHAQNIVNYLNKVIGTKDGFKPQPLHTQLKKIMTTVDVKVVCDNKKIKIALRGFADGDFEGYVRSQLESVKEEINRYIGGSHAAKWRHKVTVRAEVDSYR